MTGGGCHVSAHSCLRKSVKTSPGSAAVAAGARHVGRVGSREWAGTNRTVVRGRGSRRSPWELSPPHTPLLPSSDGARGSSSASRQPSAITQIRERDKSAKPVAGPTRVLTAFPQQDKCAGHLGRGGEGEGAGGLRMGEFTWQKNLFSQTRRREAARQSLRRANDPVHGRSGQDSSRRKQRPTGTSQDQDRGGVSFAQMQPCRSNKDAETHRQNGSTNKPSIHQAASSI